MMETLDNLFHFWANYAHSAWISTLHYFLIEVMLRIVKKTRPLLSAAAPAADFSTTWFYCFYVNEMDTDTFSYSNSFFAHYTERILSPKIVSTCFVHLKRNASKKRT
jgi:hypothetical protein